MSPERQTGRARIYVSFAERDRTRAMELVRWLNDGGWQVEADERHAFSAAAAASWTPSRRLDSCDVVLCVITPRWLLSEACHQEFTHCAKRGKFILPVICDLPDEAMLPLAIRPLPRVDLTQNRLTDYLALKAVLVQAGSRIGRVAADANDAGRQRPFSWTRLDRRSVLLMSAALLLVLVAIATVWLLAS
jgi:TIR domain